MPAASSLRIVLVLASLAGLVAALILLNLTLLGYAQPRDDPVGKLSPRVLLPTTRQAPRPVVTAAQRDEDD